MSVISFITILWQWIGSGSQTVWTHCSGSQTVWTYCCGSQTVWTYCSGSQTVLTHNTFVYKTVNLEVCFLDTVTKNGIFHKIYCYYHVYRHFNFKILFLKFLCSFLILPQNFHGHANNNLPYMVLMNLNPAKCSICICGSLITLHLLYHLAK